jgi:hypothetical protein
MVPRNYFLIDIQQHNPRFNSLLLPLCFSNPYPESQSRGVLSRAASIILRKAKRASAFGLSTITKSINIVVHHTISANTMDFAGFIRRCIWQRRAASASPATFSCALSNIQVIGIGKSLDPELLKAAKINPLADSSASSDKSPGPIVLNDSNHMAEISANIIELKQILEAHDDYVRENVAKEPTIQQLIQSIQDQLPASPVAKTSLPALKNITDNHKKILAILAADTTEFYTYQQLADMTYLTANGVRGMVSDLTKIGYRFRKTMDCKRKRIQLIQALESPNQAPPGGYDGVS